ncbi:MAG: NYN domain-containing protein [Nanoarchaeota archaeon]|nr:NYN domain-containing protein [Nanoarchaeota archaeon]
MDKTIVFIDGAYLSYISKDFGKGKPLRYKIEKFSTNLCNDLNLSCEEIYYYTAPPYKSSTPTESERQRQRNYDKFISKLKLSIPKIIVREGRCQKIDNSFQQKGVDTLMTMDLLKIAEQKKVGSIILITSDTDFVPIIKDIREGHNIQVILAYFTDKRRKSAFSLSNYLWKVCSKRILIRKEHFLQVAR